MNREPNNRNSFIRLYANGNLKRLPVTGMREPDKYSPSLILCPGETNVIYVNSTSGLGGLSLSDGSNTYGLGASVGGVSTTIGNHSIVTINLPGGVPDGVYVIQGGGFVTSGVEVINDINEANDRSAIFEFGHNSILGTFYYPYAGVNFVQVARLRCTLNDAQTDSDFENYQETSTGQMQSLAGVIKPYIILRTPDLCMDDHDAMRYVAICDRLKINGRNYHRKESSTYRTTPSMDSAGYDGEFGVYDTDATVLLRC